MVVILDTTLREGELQPGVYFTPEARRAISVGLAEIGTRRIEFPILYPSRCGKVQDIRYATDYVQRSYGDITVVVQCRACKEDIEQARLYDVKGCAVYLGVTEEHRRNKLHGLSREGAIEQLVCSLQLLRDYGFQYRRAVLEDVSRFFSLERGAEDTEEYLSDLVKSIYEAGATMISIPDTSGIIPHSQVRTFFKRVREVTHAPLAAHFHNDYGNSLANGLEAISAGAEEVHVSIYGLGSRNGITDHYELVSNLEDLYGIHTGEKREGFLELYRNFEEITGIQIPWRHPLSSLSNIEKAGTHQAQVTRSPRGYIPPRKLRFDFGGRAYFEAGQLISKQVIGELLKEYEMSEATKTEIAEAIAGRSSLKQRRLMPQEVRDIIELTTGITVPIERVVRTIRGSEYTYILLNLKPQYSGRRIVDEVTRWREVAQADEVYGDVDVVILSRLKDAEGREVVDKIKEKFGDGIVKIATWILE